MVKGYHEQLQTAQTEYWKYVTTAKTETSAVPSFWQPQQDLIQLLDVPATSSEFQKVQARFNETQPAPILRLQRIQNTRLWENFSYELNKLRSKYGTDPNRLNLFHGTRTTAPEAIFRGQEEGFDMRYCSSGMWGQGIYFAVNASYSNSYAHTNSKGEKEMFMADVIVGQPYNCPSDPSLRMPPFIPGNADRYDSVTGETGGSVVFIIYANSKAYPQYLITYR